MYSDECHPHMRAAHPIPMLHISSQYYILFNLPMYKISTFVSKRYYLFIIFIMSTGERPFLDILQDRRYWLIHLITIPSLFLAGVIFIGSSFVYKLFGQRSFNEYFYNRNTLRHISLINDRFSGLNEISDI
jgi:photosystem II cytochrome b559 subunit alpha